MAKKTDAGRGLGKVLKRAGQARVGLALPSSGREKTNGSAGPPQHFVTGMSVAPVIPEGAMYETIDYGDPSNVSPLTVQARGDALNLARQRAQGQAPRRGAGSGERAVPIDELESHGPIPKGWRPPTPRFPGLGQDQVSEFASEQPPTHYDPDAAIRRMNEPIFTPPAAKPRTGLALRPLLEEDVDQVWDWIRTEETRAEAFFGVYIRTALQLHMQMRNMITQESQGSAMVRAVDSGGMLIGLAAAWPLDHTDKLATLHLYIRPDLRNRLAEILPSLIAEGERVIPAGLRLAIVPEREGWIELLRPLGFVAHTVLIRER